MTKLQDLRTVIGMLEPYISNKKGNINFGDFPIVAGKDGKFDSFNYRDRFAVWGLPIGIPYVVNVSGDMNKPNIKVAAYMINDRLFVHTGIFKAHRLDTWLTRLYNPIRGDVLELCKAGWVEKERTSYEQFLWNYCMEVGSADFYQVSGIRFDAKADIDYDILMSDGWYVNRIPGMSAYYGIITCGINKQADDKYDWYNKYFANVELTSGNGVKVYGDMANGHLDHPHIDNGYLCEQDYAKFMSQHLNKGEMTQFFVLLGQFLRSYSTGSPYFHLPLPHGTNFSGNNVTYYTSKMRFN